MDPRQLREAALYYHRQPKPGKIAVTPIKQLTNQIGRASCRERVSSPV